MGISPRRVVELVIPPALLSYFVWAWRRCTFLVGCELDLL
jgi:hypothetical protein